MRCTQVAGAFIIVVLSAALAGESIGVDVQNVPVERVIANLERQVRERPADADLRVSLARVHAMAFAEKRTAIPTASYAGTTKVTVPWVSHFVPDFHQFEVKASDDLKVTAVAREHLTKAIARYREALELAPAHQVAKMGLGWTLSQTGDRAGAVAVLRDLISQSLDKDRRGVDVMAGFRSITEEAARYLIPLLDPEHDRAEIDRLRAAAKELARQPRPITPIAVPLRDRMRAQDIVNPQASVPFDLDGSALPQRWTWIRPTAAWLVFDKRGTGSITSGLQLFGSVTFWLFWHHGYDALRSLDDDGDGRIARGELAGLALWHDRNSDGRSDRGEVRPVPDWGIVSLSCEYHFDTHHPDEIAMSPRGVTFRDGTTRATFDLVLAPASR
ncbi:MAG TPA: tetratricopeptide repeat protein [Vicinamibacterales bacterium]|nr:tetratricopeptide repeat protein [Vicinamibacterales bacterium]